MRLKELLRSLDALQLACALHIQNTQGISPIFVSAEARLLAAAAATRLMTDNPTLYE